MGAPNFQDLNYLEQMGSVDPGFGTAYLARCVGEKKAREMWYLCWRYCAREALTMGLVNAVVADDELDVLLTGPS